jgi:hypothetical protein
LHIAQLYLQQGALFFELCGASDLISPDRMPNRQVNRKMA